MTEKSLLMSRSQNPRPLRAKALPITPPKLASSAVLRLAEAYGLSAYDAEYAALAEWLDCKIVSFDNDLLKPGLAIHPKDF